MVVAICLIVSTAAMAAETEDTQEIQFDIPQQRADPALTEFALQADISVIFRQDVVRKYEANPLVGKYSVSRGAEELLRDSGLSANTDERGHLAIFVTPSRETQVKSKPSYFRRLAAAVAATLTASPAVAQPQDYEQPVLEEVVVTAMKRQQVLSDVPISIQAFTGEQLEDRGIADIRDVFTQIPGATEGTGGSPGTRQFFIRSVGSLFGDATVGYYLDQAAFSLPGGGQYAPVATTWDLGRVEVLRGPQGTLYGQGAMGGQIRFISAAPDLERFRVRGQASASGTQGGDANDSASLAVSAPVVPGVFAIRASADYQSQGGYAEITDFPDRENLGDSTTKTYRLTALLTPSPEWRFQFAYWHTENQYSGCGFLISVDPPFCTQGSDLRVNENSTEYDLFSLFASYDAGRFSIESSSGYIETGRTSNSVLQFFGFPLFYTADAPGDVFTQELRFVSNGEGPLNWLLGGYYQDGTAHTDSEITGFVNLTTMSQNHSEAKAVFGEISYDLMDGKLTPLIGGRWFHNKRTYRDAAGAAITTDAATFETFNPRFNLSYRPTEGRLYYFNAAKGFRSGAFNVPLSIIVNGDGPGGYGLPVKPNVDPDELWTYELGGKWTVLNRTLDFGATVYFTRWSDMQVTVNPVGIAGASLNAGEAEVKGLELEFAWRTPIDGLTLSGNASISDSEFVELSFGVADTPDDGLSIGGRIPFTADKTATLTGDYSFPLGVNGFQGRILSTLSYIGDQIDVSSGAVSDDHTLLSARFGVEKGHWAVFLYGENLLDDSGTIYTQRNVAGDFLTRFYPRVIGVQLKFDY